MLVSRIYSFIHNVFYPATKETKVHYLNHNKLSSANAFNLEKAKIMCYGINLTLSQTSPGFYMFAAKVF